MKKLLKLLAVVMAFALVFTTAATVALATEGEDPIVTPGEGTGEGEGEGTGEGTGTGASTPATQAFDNNVVTINKYLVVESDVLETPPMQFTFSIAPGTAVASTETTMEILAGVGAPVVSAATFTAADALADGTPADSTDTAHKFATETFTVDFTGVTFPAPGVYRYVITEDDTTEPGVTKDSKVTWLDVFVVKNAETGALEIDTCVLRDATKNNTINITEDADTGDRTAAYAADPDTKTDSFENTVVTNNLEFKKTISGNQADTSKEFAFTLEITGAKPGNYTIEFLNGTNPADPHDSNRNYGPVNTTEGTSYITVGADGTYTGTFYLTNDETVKVYGLTSTATYTVSEANEDYKATVKTDDGAFADGDSATGTMDADHSIVINNERKGLVPTGVLLTIAPFAIGILLFGAIMLYITAKRRRSLYD